MNDTTKNDTAKNAPVRDTRNNTLKIGGKRFFCTCGANVFHLPEPEKNPNLYGCNGCGMQYETE